jgi:Uncharacterized NAD(FAD)-dependent dehydrogenases
LKADLVILSTGVRPRTHLVANTDIKLHIDEVRGRVVGGILVDEYQRTSDPDVYAAGDICSGVDAWGRQRWIALFPPAQQGGAVAGYNMAGLKVKHSGLVDYNAVKTRSVPAGSGGLFEDAESSLVFEYEEYLIKVFLKEDKVYGYQFVGRPTKRRLNQANPFLKGLDCRAFLNNRGLGLEASGVLFHHFIKQRDRTFSSEVVEVIKRGMLRSLGNPKFDVPLFHRE